MKRPCLGLAYTTNPTERSAASTECSTSESDLESPVESHRASGIWDSTGDSKSLSLVEHSVDAAERSVGLVV